MIDINGFIDKYFFLIKIKLISDHIHEKKFHDKKRLITLF